MTIQLYWLIIVSLLTSLMWLPYILNRIAVRGLMSALSSTPGDSPHADWAERSILAHRNAVENLAIFAPLVLATHVLGVGTSLTGLMCMLYCSARIIHYVIYYRYSYCQNPCLCRRFCRADRACS
jgi:uncharacterized MAPEG superfamily protein